MSLQHPSDVPVPAARRKQGSAADFWRACGYLRPHRGLVIISVLCAFLVGLTLAGNLASMLPILRLLINGDSFQNWVNRRIVEDRLGVRLADDRVCVLQAAKTAPLDLAPGDFLSLTGAFEPGGETLTRTLSLLSDPNVHETRVYLGRPGMPAREVAMPLAEVKWYWADLRRRVGRLPTQPVPALAMVLALAFALSVFGSVVRFFQDYFSYKASVLAVNDIRRRLYDHNLHLPLGFFALKGTSDTTSRLVQDSQGLQDGITTTLGPCIQEPIKAAMLFGLALVLDWHLTLFVILFGPLVYYVIKKFGKKMRRSSRRALQSSSTMLAQIEGSLGGIRVVKGAAAERFERRRYTKIMAGLIHEQLKMSRIDAMSTSVLETLTLLMVSVMAVYAGYLVHVTRSLDATAFMGLMACMVAIGESMRRFSKVNNTVQRANAAAARIFETLDVPVERRRPGTRAQEQVPAVSLPMIQREVRFQDVTFSYPHSPAPAVRHVNLIVPKGMCIAIVGRNGSGKTTLLSLLPRFYDPQQGAILIDGLDIRRATLRSLRRQIGIVTQEAIIFPGTIASNIAYGLPLARREDIVTAAKRAFCHEFIMEKPGDYDAVLGEHGGQLSGGQRQRICIARAILRQTPILILDEATSQVDAESEHLIQQAIENLMHERTTFVIAHRLGTILSADTIIVMEKGEIVGQGKHQELLVGCPTYKQLYERQLFAGPAPEAASLDEGAAPAVTSSAPSTEHSAL